MLFDQINERQGVFPLCKERSGVVFISAALSVINGSIFFDDLTAVHSAVGEQQDGIGLAIQDQNQLFDILQNGTADGQKIIHLHIIEFIQ